MGLPLGLFIGFPFLAQSSWALTLLVFPDLGYWLLAVSILLCLRAAYAYWYWHGIG
jgi:hypothetical protein